MAGLIQGIVAAAKVLGRNLDVRSLTVGLIAEDREPSTDFIPEILERAGLAYDQLKLSLEHIPKDSCPVLLQLDNDQWALWRDKDKITVYGDSGEKALSFSQLQSCYTGQAYLIYLPIKWQQSELPEADGSSWFRNLLASQSWIYSYALLATLLINLFVLVVPFFTMAVYDRVIPNNALTSLTALAIGATVILLFDFAIKNIRTYLIESAGRRIDHELGVAIFAKLTMLKTRARTQPAGQLASTIKDYEVLRNFMSGATITVLGDLPFAVLFIVVIGIVAGPMWIWPAIGLIVILVIGIVLQIPLRKLVYQSQQDNTEKNVLLYESLDGLNSLKALGAENWSTQRWRQLVSVNSVHQDMYRRWSGFSQHSASLVQMLVSIAVIVHGAILVAAGEVTSGVLIASLMLGNRAMSSSGHIASLLISYHQASLSYAIVNGIMQAESETRPLNEQINKIHFEGRIKLENVSFRYQQDLPEVFSGISLEIMPGERVGILGKIGSGKSTLLNLILGLQQPNSGRVLIDDLNLESLDKVSLRRNIGCLQQENHLFSASLRTNIALRDQTGSDDQVLKALKVVGIDQVIAQTAQGLELPIGERGGSLSGGQRQLVCLARAFYGDPPILLLDEPTSLLDNSSEQRVLKGMTDAVEEKTLILITHRPALLGLIDRLIVLDGGHIVADGPKQQVLDALNYQSRGNG